MKQENDCCSFNFFWFFKSNFKYGHTLLTQPPPHPIKLLQKITKQYSLTIQIEGKNNATRKTVKTEMNWWSDYPYDQHKDPCLKCKYKHLYNTCIIIDIGDI